jgi:hypothetical protein
MTTAKEFLRALERGPGDAQSVDEYWRRQRDAWVKDLAELRRSIVGWLEPVRAAGRAKWSDVTFTLGEPDTGEYEAPGLEIELLAADARVINVRPRGVRILGTVQTGGARVFGARGRVDLECGVAREILLRFTDDGTTRWFSFAGGQKKELDEDVFFELLARIAHLDPK